MNNRQTKNRNVLIIVGPTGVGKTGFSIFYASHHNSEIVSADSRLIYKYLDIGTAKPSPEERGSIPHHFIDIINPDQHYSAGIYGKQARVTIDQIIERKHEPLVVGGAGFYIRALVDGMFDLEAHDESLKAMLQQQVETEGLDALYSYLKGIDPIIAGRLHPNDRQRILRAIEVYKITGTPLSRLQSFESEPCNFNPVYVGLTMERSTLYRRIDRRVDSMLKKGLIDEVKQLRKMNYSENLSSLQTVGYQEVFQFLNGKLRLEEMISLIKKNTRNYAKRQLTWFNSNKNISWFTIDKEQNYKDISKIIDTNLLLR